MAKKEQKLYCVAYYERNAHNLRSCDFVTYTSCTDKKDMLDVVIRNWEVYWCEHFGLNGNEWLIMDIWSTYCGGRHRNLVARRYSRRCPDNFRFIVDDSDLIV